MWSSTIASFADENLPLALSYQPRFCSCDGALSCRKLASLGDPVLPIRIPTRIACALSQIIILSDDAEERISDTGEHRLEGEFSDAVRLLAIMA
jgi:hypothetical protein